MIWSIDFIWYLKKKEDNLHVQKKNPPYFLAIAAINTCNHNIYYFLNIFNIFSVVYINLKLLIGLS